MTYAVTYIGTIRQRTRYRVLGSVPAGSGLSVAFVRRMNVTRNLKQWAKQSSGRARVARRGEGEGMSECKHQWNYPHTIFEGRKKWRSNEIGVVRYCHLCGVKQMAFTKDWGKVPRNYKIDRVCWTRGSRSG
jgi:hypothetical protein